MALTINVVRSYVTGDRRAVVADVTFDASYATGGLPLTVGFGLELELTRLDGGIAPTGHAARTTTRRELLAFNGTTQIAALTDLSRVTTRRARGREGQRPVSVAVVPGVHRIEPVPVAQVLDGYDGRMILVDDDVAGVAADLRAIDPALELRYSERGGHFVVVQVLDEPDGRHVEHLVTTAPECDHRIVDRVRQVTDPSYDLVGELAAVEAAAGAARRRWAARACAGRQRRPTRARGSARPRRPEPDLRAVSTLAQLRAQVLAHELEHAAGDHRRLPERRAPHRARRARHYTGEAEQAFATAAGAAVYDWPADLGKIRWLRDLAAPATLQLVGLRDIDAAPIAAGRPVVYATAGKTLSLYPTPDAAYDLALRYWSLPPCIACRCDVPELPDDYHRLLVFHALQRAYELEDDFQAAGYWRDAFTGGLADMAEDVRAPNNDGPRQIPSMWERRTGADLLMP